MYLGPLPADEPATDWGRLHGVLAAIRYNTRCDLARGTRGAHRLGASIFALLMSLALAVALSGCSRPTGPSPALDCPSSIPPRAPVESPADEPVCHGDDCALPKPKR